MKGIDYYSGQRVSCEKGQFWSMERSITYRIVGAIFLFMGVVALFVFISISTPWWFYIFPVCFLIPSIMIATYSAGIDIDARIRVVDQWWKTLGFKRRRREKFLNFQGVYLDTKVHRGNISHLVFVVCLMGSAGPMTVYSSSKEDEARVELERITSVTGFPAIQPPSREWSIRHLIILVAVALLIPIVLLGMFLISQVAG